MASRVGEQFGEYHLKRKLGGGNFGDVYLSEHIREKIPAAVKVLHVRLTHPEDLKDFINEVRTLFRLQHPSIVPLLDFGIERDTPFLIMAYAPNGTLRQPRGTQLPLDIVVTYTLQVAGALQFAHDRKLIHRDVKPDNILSGPNSQIWLSDFGITTIAHSSRSLNTQDSAGTITYMAPEQFQGKPRPASDQYALSIIVYEWICGERPFNGTAMEVAMQHAQAVPPSMREKVPTLSPTVEQVVLKALEKNHEKRYESVYEFAQALAAAVERTGSLQKKTSLSEGLEHWIAGRYKEALDAYDRAIELNSRDAIAYFSRGTVYRSLKQYKQAIENFDRAISLAPDFVHAYYIRGNVYSDLKQCERAIEDYNRAIALNPRYANAYAWRGWAYYYLENYQHAIQDFDYALQLDPAIDWFLSDREEAYRKLGKTK